MKYLIKFMIAFIASTSLVMASPSFAYSVMIYNETAQQYTIQWAASGPNKSCAGHTDGEGPVAPNGGQREIGFILAADENCKIPPRYRAYVKWNVLDAAGKIVGEIYAERSTDTPFATGGGSSSLTIEIPNQGLHVYLKKK